MTDYRVMNFLTRYRYREAAGVCPVDNKVAIIKAAIEDGLALKIVYLKPNDEKSCRTIIPRDVGEMSYRNKPYLGVQAFCLTRNEERVFRVDRILELETVERPDSF